MGHWSTYWTWPVYTGKAYFQYCVCIIYLVEEWQREWRPCMRLSNFTPKPQCWIPKYFTPFWDVSVPRVFKTFWDWVSGFLRLKSDPYLFTKQLPMFRTHTFKVHYVRSCLLLELQDDLATCLGTFCAFFDLPSLHPWKNSQFLEFE